MFQEGFGQAWEARYGQAPQETLDALTPFLRHRCIRKYSDQAVSEELISMLIACGQSAATSSSLQLYSIVSVQDPERRERITELCGNQRQVRSAPWFLGFFADHHRIRAEAERQGGGATAIDYEEFLLMACIDAALAAERMVCAAEMLGLGICYIGGLRNNPNGVQELLDLPDGVFGVFGLCIGFPHEASRAEIKPRLDQNVVWFRERYDRTVRPVDFDERMRDFYRRQRMDPDDTWSQRSTRRTSEGNLTGREVLKPWLAERGMGRR